MTDEETEGIEGSERERRAPFSGGGQGRQNVGGDPGRQVPADVEHVREQLHDEKTGGVTSGAAPPVGGPEDKYGSKAQTWPAEGGEETDEQGS